MSYRYGSFSSAGVCHSPRVTDGLFRLADPGVGMAQLYICISTSAGLYGLIVAEH